jgi:hypothetical protein
MAFGESEDSVRGAPKPRRPIQLLVVWNCERSALALSIFLA